MGCLVLLASIIVVIAALVIILPLITVEFVMNVWFGCSLVFSLILIGCFVYRFYDGLTGEHSKEYKITGYYFLFGLMFIVLLLVKAIFVYPSN